MKASSVLKIAALNGVAIATAIYRYRGKTLGEVARAESKSALKALAINAAVTTVLSMLGFSFAPRTKLPSLAVRAGLSAAMVIAAIPLSRRYSAAAKDVLSAV